jgi:hypothetical protein
MPVREIVVDHERAQVGAFVENPPCSRGGWSKERLAPGAALNDLLNGPRYVSIVLDDEYREHLGLPLGLDSRVAYCGLSNLNR